MSAPLRPDRRAALAISTLLPEVLRRNTDYRRAFLGDLTSSLGSAMSAIAFPLLVLGLGGSAVQAGSVATVALASRLAVRLPAGALVDRWNRRTVALVTDLARMAALGSIPLAAAFGALRFPQLIGVAVAEGLATSLFGPAVSVLTRDLVSDDELAPALGLDQAVQSTAYLVGPAIGGALFALGRSVPFAVDAASYAASAVLLWSIKLRPARKERAGDARTAMTAGLRWLLARRPLLSVLIYAGAANLISAAVEVMAVIDLRAHGEAGGRIGAVMACAGVGAIVGSLLAPRVVSRLSVPAILLGIGVGWSLILAVFGVGFDPARTAAGLSLLMTLSPAAGIVVGHALFSQCPRPLIGRVSAATSLLLSGLSALGPIMAGSLVQGCGADLGWFVMAAAMAVATGAAWLPLRSARELGPPRRERSSAHAPTAAPAIDESAFEVMAHALPPLPADEYLSTPGALGFHEPCQRFPVTR